MDGFYFFYKIIYWMDVGKVVYTLILQIDTQTPFLWRKKILPHSRFLLFLLYGVYCGIHHIDICAMVMISFFVFRIVKRTEKLGLFNELCGYFSRFSFSQFFVYSICRG